MMAYRWKEEEIATEERTQVAVCLSVSLQTLSPSVHQQQRRDDPVTTLEWLVASGCTDERRPNRW